MSAANQNEVLFNDGEALILDDLNNSQRYAKALLFDQMFGAFSGFDATEVWPTSNAERFVFVPRAGHAYPYGTGTVRQLTNAAGTILQKTATGTPDGLTQKFLSYQLAAGELLTTFAANASGQDRIDLLAIKLSQVAAGSTTRDFEDEATEAKSSQVMNKLWQTQLSIQVVQGTPGATPSKPSIPAGYAAYCYVYIPNGFASTFTSGVGTQSNYVWDNRIPMKVRSVRVHASNFFGFTNYSYSSGSGWVSRSGAGGFSVPCPVGPGARILRVGLIGTSDDSVSMQFHTCTAAATHVNFYGYPGSVSTFGSDVSWVTVDSAVGTLNEATGAPTWGDGSSAGMMWTTGASAGSETGYWGATTQQLMAAAISTDASGTSSKWLACEFLVAE